MKLVLTAGSRRVLPPAAMHRQRNSGRAIVYWNFVLDEGRTFGALSSDVRAPARG